MLALGLATLIALGSWRANTDVDQELRSAMAVAQTVALAAAQAPPDDEVLVQRLRESLGPLPLRHLSISVRDAQGTLRMAPRDTPDASAMLQFMVDLQRRLQHQADPPPVVVAIHRPSGEPWSLVITPNPDSERRESVLMLTQTVLVLLLCTAALLVLLRWQILRCLSPMRNLLETIARLRRGDTASAANLAGMPVAELQAVSQALQELARALEDAERDRRVLSLRVQSLQEDERRRMAQELHDELGQRLTALRLETRVLQRLPSQPAVQAVAQRLDEQIQAAQVEVSQLLRRLSPRTDHALPVMRLAELLEDLCAQPAGSSPGVAPRVELHGHWGQEPLSEALMMALYRLSQEALTNARRHSGARVVRLRISREGRRWSWSCEDDGCGIDALEPAQSRGNGLAGLRERAWAFGGNLRIEGSGGGLRLEAELEDPHQADGRDAGVQGVQER